MDKKFNVLLILFVMNVDKDFLFSFYEQPFANVGLAMIAYGRKFKKYFGKDVDYSEIYHDLYRMAVEAADIYEGNKIEEAFYEDYGDKYEEDDSEKEEVEDYIALMERRFSWY